MKYPTKDSQEAWRPFGYESSMLHLAVNRDDPEGFMRFIGDPKKADFFICSSLIQYAAQHGAENILKALWEAGIEDDANTREEWLAMCEKPIYGPRSEIMRHPA
jgi:hypothetical protein